MRKRSLLALGAAIAAIPLVLTGCTSSDTSPSTGSGTGEKVVIGSANFSESQLIAEIYAQALESAGVEVERKFNIGSREVYIPALTDSSIDIIPDYQGALLSFLATDTSGTDASNLTEKLTAELPDGTSMLTPSDAQDVNVLAVTKETAKKYDLKTISDLAPVASELSEGSGPEWQTRQEGDVGLASVYGITFGSFTPLDAAGPLTLSALKNGQIDVGVLTSTDPGLADLVALEDDKGMFLPQNIAPIIRTEIESPTITDTLDAVSAKLTTKSLIEMNGKIANDHESVDSVATAWLSENGF